MRASAYLRTGQPSEIAWREVPDASLAPCEILIRPEAVGVVHVDALVRSGAWSTELRFPQAVGRDLVGVVVDPGDSGYRVGDRMFTSSAGYGGRDGATADLVAVPLGRLYPAPDDLDPDGFDPVAFVALLHSGATVHGGFERAGLLRGDTVAVTGANGVVGSHAVQWASRTGHRVIAVVRNPASVDALRRLGASEVVVADGSDALAAAAALTDGGIDVFVEASGRTDLSGLPDHLADRGRALLLAGSEPFELDRRRFYLRELQLTGFIMSQMSGGELATAAAYTRSDWAEGIRVPTTVPMPFSAAREAHEILAAGGPERDADGMVPRIVLVPHAADGR